MANVRIDEKDNAILRSMQKSIEDGLKAEIDKVFDQKLEEAIEAINISRNELISKVALNIDSWYEVTYQGSSLRITFVDREKELL